MSVMDLGRRVRPSRARAIARSEPLDSQLFTLTLYVSMGGAGILFLVGTVAYGYLSLLSLG
jgi:hypothetical protein